MHHEGESSVEEILESIKKVMARDSRAMALEQRRRRESHGMAEPVDPSDDEDEVLELGEAELVGVADEVDMSADDDTLIDPPDEDAPLVAEAARDSMRQNLAALAMLAEPGAQPQIVRSGETSLEGLVRDMLRPMLAEWLDANLPGMVEKMVRDEISRIAGKRG
ncbi:DUF2497 domain-containing protein [Leptolyngbya sp. 15MV]|nr:DUF2497 domain-containing protein [Leptolyngbya sp. 15MV]